MMCKKIRQSIFAFVCAFSCVAMSFAQDSSQSQTKKNSASDEDKFTVAFDEGLGYSKVTRIVFQNEKTNYVFEDYMMGAFLSVRTEYFEPLNPLMRLSVYTPFSTEFNNVEQSRKRFNWGIDYFAGMEFKASVKGYVNVHIAPGLHFLYEYTDRFSYIDLGIGGYINAELPVSYHWSIVLDGIGSFDFGNLGSNKLFEYYNIVWQWQTGIGFKYSIMMPNKINYMNQSLEDIQLKKDAKKALKEAKKQQKSKKEQEQ
ncbi:MAG: hypothetical protein SPI86_04380 [Treponemataceae bacterium]|nr:hypothetical protein [Spirochaetales bacterium]MDY6030986.1 hypothetical protein [Treponemataceae bacterium]